MQIPKYATNQKLLIPVSEEEAEELTQKELSDKKIKRVGDNLYRRKTAKLYWKYLKFENVSPVKAPRQSSVTNSTQWLVAQKSISANGHSPSPTKNKEKLGGVVYKEKNTVRHQAPKQGISGAQSKASTTRRLKQRYHLNRNNSR